MTGAPYRPKGELLAVARDHFGSPSTATLDGLFDVAKHEIRSTKSPVDSSRWFSEPDWLAWLAGHDIDGDLLAEAVPVETTAPTKQKRKAKAAAPAADDPRPPYSDAEAYRAWRKRRDAAKAEEAEAAKVERDAKKPKAAKRRPNPAHQIEMNRRRLMGNGS